MVLHPPAHVLAALSAAGCDRPLLALGDALVRAPTAQRCGGLVLVVRSDPDPVLAFVGTPDAAAVAAIGQLEDLLRWLGPSLEVLSWADVDRAVEQLAEQVRALLDPDEVRDVTIEAIPRGGFVVAALLAYRLGVPAGQLGDTEPGSTALVVDDVVLSGVRLREALSYCDASRVVVATLRAPEGLGEQLAAVDPRVVGSVTAATLPDLSTAVYAEDATAWRRRWSEARPGADLVTTLAPPLVFPWSEPHAQVRDTASGDVHPQWWLGPPEVCAAHRDAPRQLALHDADADPLTAHLPPGVVAVPDGEHVAIVDTADGGDGVLVGGSAADLLGAWATVGDVRAAAEDVAARFRSDPDLVAGDLRQLLDALRSRGLLAT